MLGAKEVRKKLNDSYFIYKNNHVNLHLIKLNIFVKNVSISAKRFMFGEYHND